MTGSLTIKYGKYYAVINTYENGKRRKKWICTKLPVKGNKRKAEQFLREKIAEQELLEGIIRTDITLSDYIRVWLTHVSRKVDAVTLQGYETLAKGHVLPYFDEKKIKLRDVDHVILQHINLQARTMTIKHTVSKVTKIVEKNKTKNASSFRTFPLTDEAIEIFKTAEADEQRNRKIYGEKYHENNYVFKWPDGRPYSPDYVSHRFRELLKKHNLPHIRFHELRHSCASILITMVFSLKDIQEWLGHSDIKMTATSTHTLMWQEKTKLPSLYHYG